MKTEKQIRAIADRIENARTNEQINAAAAEIKLFKMLVEQEKTWSADDLCAIYRDLAENNAENEDWKMLRASSVHEDCSTWMFSTEYSLTFYDLSGKAYVGLDHCVCSYVLSVCAELGEDVVRDLYSNQVDTAISEECYFEDLTEEEVRKEYGLMLDLNEHRHLCMDSVEEDTFASGQPDFGYLDGEHTYEKRSRPTLLHGGPPKASKLERHDGRI